MFQKSFLFIALALTIMVAQVSEADISGLQKPETAPRNLLDVAIREMSRLQHTSPEAVSKSFEIGWQYEGWYDDDQPADFIFANGLQTCLVAVGSQSNLVRESHCLTHINP